MYAPKRENFREPDENLGRWILGGVVLVALAVGLWFWQKRQAPAEAPAAPPQAAAPEPEIRHPIETPEGIDPDLPATDQVAALVGLPRFEQMFIPDDFVRRLAVTVDGLARQEIAARMIPAKPPAGQFVVEGSGEEIVLGAANFTRYKPWVDLVDSLDTDQVVALYRRLYPQLQESYAQLGNPESYFNDRVVEVIDHLLATPEPPATIALVQPNVMYEFADPALEAQSAGRKLLLRMGPGNAARVKMKLRDVRDRIASQSAPAPAAP